MVLIDDISLLYDTFATGLVLGFSLYLVMMLLAAFIHIFKSVAK